MNPKITPDLYHCTFRCQSIFRVYVEVLVYLSTIQACVFWWKCVCAPHMFKGWISSWSDTIWPAGAEGRRIRECGNNRVVQYNNKHGLQICLTPQTNTEEIWDDRHIFCISRIRSRFLLISTVLIQQVSLDILSYIHPLIISCSFPKCLWYMLPFFHNVVLQILQMIKWSINIAFM